MEYSWGRANKWGRGGVGTDIQFLEGARDHALWQRVEGTSRVQDEGWTVGGRQAGCPELEAVRLVEAETCG